VKDADELDNPSLSHRAVLGSGLLSNNDGMALDGVNFRPASATRGDGTNMHRETIRRQRIESEQMRRAKLRDGYRRLKDALLESNQKVSKCLRSIAYANFIDMVPGNICVKQAVSQIDCQLLTYH
jgi:hypothetical protein